MYTREQKKIILYTREKVRKLFSRYPVAAHSFDHVARVAGLAMKIATGEKANIFLCEMAGLLHDIGRTIKGRKINHHELSYELGQRWFREDEFLKIGLSKKEKLELLYSIRNHNNDFADKYETAIILRDADKMDGLGNMGVKRFYEFYGNDPIKMETNLRFIYQYIFFIRTKTGKRIVNEMKLLEPVYGLHKKVNLKKIKPIKL